MRDENYYLYICGNSENCYIDVTKTTKDEIFDYVELIAQVVCRNMNSYSFSYKKISNEDFFYWVEKGEWKEQSTKDFELKTRFQLAKHTGE